MTQTTSEDSLARLLESHGESLDQLTRSILTVHGRIEKLHPDVIDRLEQAIVMLADASDHLNWCAQTMRRENQ